ncbi:NRAMP family divalent metal transporter [Desulfurivibrio sp. C05AmB]|uniref:NRAMP family divalent metal transporter n=1 Tax=Desulfurivibrio sp. C05AmB TaxID=3374371 RepID=UPI00376F25C3
MESAREDEPAGKTTWANLGKALGPGILVACAAVGGSHLVWSTRAGAEFGWSLVGLVLLANLFKFPFFLYGQRYTAATGESLLTGYYRHGVVFVWIFLLFNILTGTINVAGVAMLSAALFAGYGFTALPVAQITVLLVIFCALVLLGGQYRFLDGFAKVTIAVLGLSTLLAVAFAFFNYTAPPPDFRAPSPWTLASFAFLIGLLGWMPAPVDLSAWSSLWMFSRQKQTGHFATPRETAVDFYLGYVSAVFLAVVFLALGALVMHGTGVSFAASGIAFSAQLVQLYTETIGDWSRLLILSAAFVTMFSTTMTCIDGYPRALAACCSLIGRCDVERFAALQRFWVVAVAGSACLVVLFFVQNLVQLLTFAAVASFLTSPVLAYINYKVMNGANVPRHHRPGRLLKLLSWSGLVFFGLMTAGYLYVLLFYGG